MPCALSVEHPSDFGDLGGFSGGVLEGRRSGGVAYSVWLCHSYGMWDSSEALGVSDVS